MFILNFYLILKHDELSRSRDEINLQPISGEHYHFINLIEFSPYSAIILKPMIIDETSPPSHRSIEDDNISGIPQVMGFPRDSRSTEVIFTVDHMFETVRRENERESLYILYYVYCNCKCIYFGVIMQCSVQLSVFWLSCCLPCQLWLVAGWLKAFKWCDLHIHRYGLIKCTGYRRKKSTGMGQDRESSGNGVGQNLFINPSWDWENRGAFLWERDGTGVKLHSCVTL